MFDHLKTIVDLFKPVISELRKIKDTKERKSTVVDILKFYFLLKDCVDDGEWLIQEAKGNPTATINDLPPVDAELTAQHWDQILKKQGARLYTLQGYLVGDHHIAVINPALKEKLNKAIGYKMDSVVTLHGIGSALFFNIVLPINKTPIDKANLVGTMAGAEVDGRLDMGIIQDQIKELRTALEQYHSYLERVVTDEEILSLSKLAREQTTDIRG